MVTPIKKDSTHSLSIENAESIVPMTRLGQKIEEVVNETLQKAEPFFAHLDRLVLKTKGFTIYFHIDAVLVHAEFFSDGKTASEKFLKTIDYCRDRNWFQKMPRICSLTMEFKFQYIIKTHEVAASIIPNLASTGFTILSHYPHGIQRVEKTITFKIENPSAAASTTAAAQLSAANSAQK